MVKHPPMKIPIIPIGKIYEEYKKYMEEMGEIGLEGAGTHPIEVFIVGTNPDIENPYEGEYFFDVEDARLRRNTITEESGKDSAGVFKVTVELKHDGAC